MKEKIQILLLTFLLAPLALAEVVPVTLVTGRGEGSPDGVPSSYTVPGGKVLIIESVQYQNPGGSLGVPSDLTVQVRETFDNANVRRFVFINFPENRAFQQHYFPTPIRLKAGSLLGASRIQGFYIWRGLLVDTTDLFAQLEVELEGTKLDNNRLMATAKVSSSRPHRLKIESSTDLATFVADQSAVVTPSADPKVSDVSVAAVDAKKKFIRATAEVRP